MTTSKDHIIRAALTEIGLTWTKDISWNASAPDLYGQAMARGEGVAAEGGALVVNTGRHTGRSPQDKFIVRDAITENTVWWENNGALSPAQFASLKSDFLNHARLKSLFVQDLVAGADPAHSLPTRVICEFGWHSLFIQHLLRQPEKTGAFSPELTIIDLPSFKADPAKHGTRSDVVIAFDLSAGLVLIGGTEYAGEIKKAVFTVMNYLLPAKGVLPMHCSANQNANGETALFFGLSGTGKTTLSSDPQRPLIGDDEHGWSDAGIFNIEGGCYAKVIRLSKEAEPEIHRLSHSFGTVLENVGLDPDTHEINFDDSRRTENTRAAYPLSAVSNVVEDGQGATPKTVIFLTADAFGVLPPIAKLTPAQAMYHFLSGYTAKVAGTERGVKEPQATFSACFGAPFLPRPPQVYGDLLQRLMDENGVSCYLVNTGWTGGGYGTGQRMPINVTRSLVNAALSGELTDVETRIDPHFGFAVPQAVRGLDAQILNPRATWADGALYDVAALKLKTMFDENATPIFLAAARIAAE